MILGYYLPSLKYLDGYNVVKLVGFGFEKVWFSSFFSVSLQNCSSDSLSMFVEPHSHTFLHALRVPKPTNRFDHLIRSQIPLLRYYSEDR